MTANATPAPTPPAARSPWLVIPPPLLFALAIVAGVLLNRRMPFPIGSGYVQTAVWWVGLIVLLAGVVLAPGSVALFARRRTTVIPHARASALVTSGPYRLTRNPMYVGLTLVVLGVALLANTFWPLPLLALPLWVLQTKVIPYEERMMADTFGVEYAAYQARVRRWL